MSVQERWSVAMCEETVTKNVSSSPPTGGIRHSLREAHPDPLRYPHLGQKADQRVAMAGPRGPLVSAWSRWAGCFGQHPARRVPVARARNLWPLTLAYTIFVILFGAVVRVTGSGAGCGQHWP